MSNFDVYLTCARKLDSILDTDPFDVYGVTNYMDKRIIMAMKYYENDHEKTKQLESLYKEFLGNIDGDSYFIPNSGTYKLLIPKDEILKLF